MRRHLSHATMHVDDLPADLRAVVTEEPLHLPAWDPMGALA